MTGSLWWLRNLKVAGRRVLVRVDFNVPLDKNGSVADDSRIRAVLPTINFLLKKKCRVILMSHLGRPKGVDEKLRMNSVANVLEKLLHQKIIKLDYCVGPSVKAVVKGMKECDIVLLENLRFHLEEEANAVVFAKSLASLADVYVDDAFGAMHRAHASVDKIADFLPSGAGLLVEAELKVLTHLLKHPAHPFVAVMGGAKVSDKIMVIESLLKKVDCLLVGGAMMFTFLKSHGFEVGKSFVDYSALSFVKKMLKRNKIRLPVDVVVAGSRKSVPKTVVINRIPKSMTGFDIGHETIVLFKKYLSQARTVFWNGPLGLCEENKFAKGTESIAKYIAGLKATAIVGGGDSIAVVSKLKLNKKFSHVSTGGGATLEFLEGKKLPGIAALERNKLKFSKYHVGGAL
ncbi:phosphoglycerate kinase [Candidatus Woesearchaeota archaeon]|nr:phosphoglycerate kinase [Candidatus Woesearchaeota archaeon]